MRKKKKTNKNQNYFSKILGIYADFFKNNFLAVSLLIGFSIRIYLLFQPEQYWFDEVLSTYISRYNTSIPNLIRFLQHGEYHPPLYYIIMFYWTRAFGISEIATRSFSLIFGLATLPLFYAFARKLFSKKVSALALFLLSINALHIEYSIEARPYTFFTFIGLLAAYFFVLLIKERKRIYWFWFILLNIIGLYIHYSYSFIFASFVAFQIFTHFSKRIEKKYKFCLKEIVLTVLLVTTGFSLWFPTLVTRSFEVISGFEFNNVECDLKSIGFQQTYIEELISNLFWFMKTKTIKAFLLTVFLGKLITLIIIFKPLEVSKKFDILTLDLLLSLFFVPILIFIMSNYFSPYSQVNARHIIFSVFPLCLLIAYKLLNLPIYHGRGLVLSMFILSFLVPLSYVAVNNSEYNYFYRTFELVKHVEKNEKKGDYILFDQHIYPLVFKHYYKGLNEVKTFFPAERGKNCVILDKGDLDSLKTKFMIHTNLLNKNNYQELSKTIGDSDRVWLVQILENKYFVKYLIENGWVLKDIAPLENTFPVHLYEKKSKQQ